MDKIKLTCRKEIRLSVEELGILEEKAGEQGVKVSKYLRMLITNRPRDYPEIQEQMRQLVNEINHIGVNINQITHNNNSELYYQTDKKKLYIYLQQVKQFMEQLIELI